MTDARQPSTLAWRCWLFWLAVLLMCAAALAATVPPLLTIARMVPLDYNEGWNAMWSDVALGGGALYPPSDASVANNYPPLSFFVVGLLGRLSGDNILAGRVVALVSLLTIAWGIFSWLRETGSSMRIAAAGAAIYLATFAGFAPRYIAMDDPQLLAHAIMTAAMVVLWRSDFSRRSVAAAAVLVMLAGFTKHLLLPMPLAATLWLAAFRRSRLLVWLVSCAAAALLLCATTWLAYGPDFFQGLLAGRLFSLHVAEVATLAVLRAFAPALMLSLAAIVGTWLSWQKGHSPGRASFALLYLVVAALIGGLAAGGAGVDVNAFFDLLIAASVCAALGLEAIESAAPISTPPASTLETPTSTQRLGAGKVLALLALWIVATLTTLQVGRHLARDIAEVSRLDAREAAVLSVIGTLQHQGNGHAACEELALCYWAHASFEVDFYNYGQKLKTRALANTSCEELFGSAQIPVLQLDNSPRRGESHLTEECWAIIHANFAIIPSPSREWTLLVNRSTGP